MVKLRDAGALSEDCCIDHVTYGCAAQTYFVLGYASFRSSQALWRLEWWLAYRAEGVVSFFLFATSFGNCQILGDLGLVKSIDDVVLVQLEICNLNDALLRRFSEPAAAYCSCTPIRAFSITAPRPSSWDAPWKHWNEMCAQCFWLAV